jgi:hypothetical protein
VKVQYFGDVNDYRKFALLRLLAEVGGFEIGVCWMLTEPDDSKEGGNRSYLQRADIWGRYDRPLFDLLSEVPAEPTIEDLKRIEAENLIPGATFFDKCAPDALSAREAYHKACMNGLHACDLVFLDPDNGLEGKSRAKGHKGSSKFAYLDEVADHYSAGQSILLYQHFPRHVSRETCIANAASRLAARLPRVSIWSIVTAHVVFLLAVRSEREARAAAVVETLSARGWLPHFVKSASRCELSTAAKAGPPC